VAYSCLEAAPAVQVHMLTAPRSWQTDVINALVCRQQQQQQQEEEQEQEGSVM